MDIERSVGQLLMVGFQDNDLKKIEEAVKRYHFGNLILFTRNIRGKAQLQDFIASVREIVLRETGMPPLVALDQECGMVQRIYHGITFYSGNMAVGATGDSGLAYETGVMLGAELRDFGVNMNLAPDVDVNNNAANPVIGVRSYGSDPALVAEMGSAMTRGLAESHILATVKHFPGHGDVSVDSHYSVPAVSWDRAHLNRTELVPFVRAVRDGCECVMVGHILLTAVDNVYPATYSKKVVSGLLRDELGYDGLIMTDCFEMGSIVNGIGVGKAAAKSVSAGVDLVEISHHLERQAEAYEGILTAVKTGELTGAEIERHVGRVLIAKAKYCGTEKIPFNRSAHETRAREIAAKSIRLAAGKPFRTMEDTALIAVENSVNTIAEDRNPLSISLGEEMRARFGIPTAEFSPQNADVSELLKAAEGKKQVILALADANLFPVQLRLYDALLAAGHEIEVISMRTPYDMDERRGYAAHICCHEYTALSIGALMDFLSTELA